jgi:hypothetical protein
MLGRDSVAGGDGGFQAPGSRGLAGAIGHVNVGAGFAAATLGFTAAAPRRTTLGIAIDRGGGGSISPGITNGIFGTLSVVESSESNELCSDSITGSVKGKVGA